jgi:hypothetical protein
MIKGKFIAELEQSMPLKRTLNILLWIDRLSLRDWHLLQDLDRLRLHIANDLNSACAIRLLVFRGNEALIPMLARLALDVDLVDEALPQGMTFDTGDANLQRALAVALANDADYVIVPPELLPYLEDVDHHYHVTLTDSSFLLMCVDVFVRGFDIPWSFNHPILYQTFTTLYLVAERVPHFQAGFDLMNDLQGSTHDRETIETGRTLVFNRLSNICFTRDRLLFYLQQRQAALRNHVKRQEFKLETAYHLNFYYLLLYGMFDHAAMLINGALKLGLKNRDVGASYPKFLDALKLQSPELHSIFTREATVDLMDKFAALRHYAAHRGSIAPALVVEAPKNELTDAEVDEALKETGGHEWFFEMEDGAAKEGLLRMLRSNKRAEILEQNVVARDVVFIEIRGKNYHMQPLNDITWSFDKAMSFLRDFFQELRRYIADQVKAKAQA